MGENSKQQIDGIKLTEGIVKRVSTVHIEKTGSGKLITAWQCSMINMIRATLKFYSTIEITLDENGIVTKAKLSDDFIGSQGLFCRPECLNRIAEKYLVGMSFDNDNTIFRDKNMFACRHIFELVSAAVTFYRFCDFSTSQKEFHFSDSVWGDCKENGKIITENNFELNGDTYRLKNDITYGPDNVIIDNLGNFIDINNLKMHFRFIKNDGELLNFTEELIDLHGDTLIKNRFMRIFVALWNKAGRCCGAGKNFYFTNLQPIAYSGMILETIVRIVRADNPECFGGLLKNLQHINGRPLCLGMVTSEEDLQEYFPDI